MPPGPPRVGVVAGDKHPSAVTTFRPIHSTKGLPWTPSPKAGWLLVYSQS